MKVIREEKKIPAKTLCHSFGIVEATYYRWSKTLECLKDKEKVKNKRHWRRLNESEETDVLEKLMGDRFVDMAPEAIVATLLDEGEYLCSSRTMYRILNRHKAVKERRNQLRHPVYVKPELLATKPNELWSWDITKLKTGKKWSYYHLYVIMDVYSRCVVGWMVADKESATLAEEFIAETCFKEGISSHQLTIHADRGAAMKSKAVSQLMADLNVTKTHSRPHVSNDNPYSESNFKTLKYHSKFPKRFGSLEDTKIFLREWFQWYNNVHKHSGIQMLSPIDVHTGKHEVILAKRREVLKKAYEKHPDRFLKGEPCIKNLSREVWINKPSHKDADGTAA
jgi:putative transposase